MFKTLTVSTEAMEILSQNDPILGAYIHSVGALSREGIVDPYIATLDAIIAQQVSAKAATSISERFFTAFPEGDPKKVLDASLEELKACGLSSSKANYLKNIAEAKASGRVPFEDLHLYSSEDVRAFLLPIKGVGRWTVEMVQIFSLEKMDILSYDDLAIRRGIQVLYHKKTVTPAFFKKLYKRFSPYQTFASVYLWHASVKRDWQLF